MYHKIDETTINDGENLDLAMPIYNLIEYSSNSSEATRSLWFYLKDEATNFNPDFANDNKSKSFKYKAKLLGNTVTQPGENADHGILWNVKIAVSLKYLSNFWRSFEVQLINYKVELKLRWTKYCVLSVTVTDNANGNDNDNNIVFTVKDKKLYVPAVTLSKIIKTS